MDNATSLPVRGKTWFDGTTPPTTYAQTVKLEGQLARFNNEDPSNVGVKRDGRQVICRLVRNVANITLAPKRLVRWQDGYRGERVDGYACVTAADNVAGVVDEMYSTGIPDNDLGWIVVAGPCNILTDLAGGANNLIAYNDLLIALTAATSGCTTAGRVQPWSGVFTATQTTDGTARDVLTNYIGKAMTSKTTAETNDDVLVDVELLKAVS